MQTQIIFEFNSQSDVNNWRVINDIVMGGRSSGSFTINKNGHGIFKGQVSLENNGGFSLLRYQFKKIYTTGYTKALLHIKGDGKQYQFRVKSDASDYYVYVANFKTTTMWQTIEIPLKEMYPAFRGRTLDIGKYNANSIEEIAFLIGNKKNENFLLQIDSISLK